MKQLLVTGPVVVLPDATTGKTAYYYQGAILPDGLDKERVKGVIADGLVEEVEAPVAEAAPEPKAPAPDPNKVPDGTADEVKAWVGEDVEKAKLALAAEQKLSSPRKTLVDHLVKVANPAKTEK